MKNPIPLLPVLALALLAAGACRGMVEQAYPERHQHMIRAERTGEPASRRSPSVLCVRRASISQAYEGVNLVYRTGESTFQCDFYNRFFVPPAAQVNGLTLDWLRAAGVFAHITSPSNPLIPTYYLETHLSAIYGDFANPEHPAAVVDLQFFLLDNRDLPTRVIFELPVTRRVPLAGTEPADLLDGWRIAFSEIFWELEARLALLD